MKTNILVITGQNRDEWDKIIASLQKNKSLFVFTANKAGTAYKLLRTEAINIALSDYSIPKVNSISFLKKIKVLRPDVEVVFLSENANLSKAIAAMKEGAYDFYELPVNLRLLNAVISKAIEKQALLFEKLELERKVKEVFDFGNIIGRSKPMQRITELVSSLAQKNVNVLITGETGVGKELVANALHYNSARSAKPFVKVNCAAFNKGVLESELFGHEIGSFTGAVTKRLGRFELANEGTIFLDEIGDVPLSTQVKLLRVLQEKEFERVGGNETIKIDTRVLAGTNKDMKKLVEKQKFRSDLYYRLNVVHIEVPTLKERKGDIPLLVSFFINKLNDEKDYKIKGIAKEAMQILMNYQWPGNVRELENAVESAMALAQKNVIEPKYLVAFTLGDLKNYSSL